MDKISIFEKGNVMNQDPQIKNLIDGLVAIELALADFYRVCASLFSQDKALWKKMAEEEHHHADWLKDIKARAEAQGCRVYSSRFNSNALATYLLGVKDQTSKLFRAGATRENALSLALSFESSIIEKNFYGALTFSGKDCDFRSDIMRIQKETQDHRNRIAMQKSRL